jgi:hypothetical protein
VAATGGRPSQESETFPYAGRITLALLLTLMAGACWGENGSPQPRRNTDSAQLSQLGLTSEIPSQVRAACEKAQMRATVRVLCPKLIPDVPLFTPGAGLHGPISFEPTYYVLSFNNGDPPGPARHWIVGGGLPRAVQK